MQDFLEPEFGCVMEANFDLNELMEPAAVLGYDNGDNGDCGSSEAMRSTEVMGSAKALGSVEVWRL
ncbi:hypothetical protein Scep_014193 [Stephania cephalantha]|uniref:Uncharacterized protein n=1 Tax=Stephania cephalantha TaxID=152367 RepID=A0AAP0NZ61_9MAGN